MQNREFDDILASLQQIVRQAYALGRADALKQVVEVLKQDPTSARPLALLEHAGDPSPAPAEAAKAAHLTASNDDSGRPAPETTQNTATGPWWAREPRRMW